MTSTLLASDIGHYIKGAYMSRLSYYWRTENSAKPALRHTFAIFIFAGLIDTRRDLGP